jgi:hypothetical protein
VDNDLVMEGAAAPRGVLAFFSDQAVTLTLFARVVSFVSAPITLLLVATRLSPVYQGFYYTFTTITALTTLLELGLGMVLTQFASHEFAHLHWTSGGALDGDETPRRFLLGILIKACRWYLSIALVACVVFVPAGLVFFHAQAEANHVRFAAPWILLVILTGFGLVAVPLVSVIEGCGRVTDVTRLRLTQTGVANILLWAGILGGQTLYAPGLAALGPVVVPAVWLVRRYPGLLRQLWRAASAHVDAHVSWRDELLPMQWRIAVSWLAGFLVFSLFNPLLFHYQGAAIAGQMGMSLTLANAPYAIATAWVAARAPRYGTLIRRGEYAALDRMARIGTMQAVIVWAAGSIGLLIVVAVCERFAPSLAHRVLGLGALAALAIANLVNVLMQAMASYLRAHKEEPFVGVSIATGLIVALGLWIAAHYGSALSMALTFAAIAVAFELPIAVTIFITKRREWHSTA